MVYFLAPKTPVDVVATHSHNQMYKAELKTNIANKAVYKAATYRVVVVWKVESLLNLANLILEPSSITMEKVQEPDVG